MVKRLKCLDLELKFQYIIRTPKSKRRLQIRVLLGGMSHPPFSVCSPESADGSNSPRSVGTRRCSPEPKGESFLQGTRIEDGYGSTMSDNKATRELHGVAWDQDIRDKNDTTVGSKARQLIYRIQTRAGGWYGETELTWVGRWKHGRMKHIL